MIITSNSGGNYRLSLFLKGVIDNDRVGGGGNDNGDSSNISEKNGGMPIIFSSSEGYGNTERE